MGSPYMFDLVDEEFMLQSRYRIWKGRDNAAQDSMYNTSRDNTYALSAISLRHRVGKPRFIVLRFR